MTSTRPGCITGSAARSVVVIASSRSQTARTSAGGMREPGGWRPGRRRQPQRDAPRPWSPMPARPTRVRACRARRRPPRPRRARRSMSAVPRPTSSAVGGSPCRCRSVSRTQPMSTERAASTPRRCRRARTRSSRRRCRRRGTAAGRRRPPRRSPVAPAKDSSASSSPVTTSGSTPSASRTPATNSSRLARVAGRGGRDDPHPLGAERRGTARRTRRARRSVRSSASGGEPAGAVDALPEPHDLHPASDVGEPRRRRPTSATSSRIELVPQSIAATRVTRRPPRRLRAHGPAAHQSGSSVERLVAERVHAGPGGERVRDQHVQALDPVGHAAGGDAGDLGHVAELRRARRGSPRARPRTARAARGRRRAARSSRASARLLQRPTARRSAAGRSGSTSVGNGVPSGSRGAVSHDVGQAARAAVRDRDDARAAAAELARTAARSACATGGRSVTCGHRRAPAHVGGAGRLPHGRRTRAAATSGAATAGHGGLSAPAERLRPSEHDVRTVSPGSTKCSRSRACCSTYAGSLPALLLGLAARRRRCCWPAPCPRAREMSPCWPR